ncbi:MAG TPA: hypothetical protein VGB68_01865, partial [Pyrinomonadaceae bacterium]
GDTLIDGSRFSLLGNILDQKQQSFTRYGTRPAVLSGGNKKSFARRGKFRFYWKNLFLFERGAVGFHN